MRMNENEFDQKLVEAVKTVGSGWVKSPYYDNVENQVSTFWGEGTVFRKLFNNLDLESVVELACGHGRHANQIVNEAKKITLLDINQTNVDFCEKRFASASNVKVYLNNGLNFVPVKDCSVTSVFCYDAMVHFDHRNVLTYLKDLHRILVDGGLGLFHHSNNSYPFAKHYGQNPHSRNFMTKELFARYALDCDLEVVEQHVINWGGGEKLVKNLDCVSLLRKS